MDMASNGSKVVLLEVEKTQTTVSEFKWEIQNFMSIFEEFDKFYSSSDIYIAGEFWGLGMSCYGFTDPNFCEYIDLLLYRKTYITSSKLEVFFSFKTSDEKKNQSRHYTEYILYHKTKAYIAQRCLSRTECLKRKSELLPFNVLTVLCTVMYTESTEDSSFKMLSENFGQFFLHGTLSDVILKVEDREFNVHKLILIARSPVFAPMFTHDFAEKDSKVVNISDCTAEAFEVLLQYLYYGCAKSLTTSNVYDVYYASDKYQVNDLKKMCLPLMIKMTSAETFCDVFAFALLHGESKVQEILTSYFCRTKEKILKTEQWQTFAAENPIPAYELLAKHSLTTSIAKEPAEKTQKTRVFWFKPILTFLNRFLPESHVDHMKME